MTPNEHEANTLDLAPVLLASKAERMQQKFPAYSERWAEVARDIEAARRSVWPMMSAISRAIVR